MALNVARNPVPHTQSSLKANYKTGSPQGKWSAKVIQRAIVGNSRNNSNGVWRGVIPEHGACPRIVGELQHRKEPLALVASRVRRERQD